MKKIFVFSLILLSLYLTSCLSNRKSSANIDNVSGKTTNEDLAYVEEGKNFLTDLYNKIKNEANFDPYQYLTDRFAFATYQCDWDIFLNSQEFPDEFSVSVEKYNECDTTYLVKIDGGTNTWFNTELLYSLAKEEEQWYIDNIMDKDGQNWLANYSDKKNYKESIISTPDKKTYENEIQWLDGWGWQLREDIDNDNIEETIILNIEEDNDLSLSLRKNHKYYELTKLQDFINDNELENKIQISFYDIDKDSVAEIFLAYFDNEANSKLYAWKINNQDEYSTRIIVNALHGNGRYSINNNTLTIPFGTSGVSERYIYENNSYNRIRQTIF